MAVTIEWKDNNTIEIGHRVYKNSTYFTKDNLPAPLVDLGPNISEYEDTASNDGENWYIISAYITGYEVFSKPFIPGIVSSLSIHDIFGDGSAIATYTLQGDSEDLSKNYNGTWQGTESYVNDLNTQVAKFNRGSAINLGSPLLGKEFTISLWVKFDDLGFRQVAISQYQYSDYMIFIESPDILEPGYAGNDDTGSGLNVVRNQWYHMVTTRNANNDHTLYLNGEEKGTGRTTEYPTPNYNTVIGSTTNFPEFNLDGRISQVRIFDREVTQEEVDTLYAEHSGDV